MGNTAQGFEFSNWSLQRPGAARSFFLSLTIHTAVVALAWNVNPRPIARSFPEPRLAEFLDPDAHKLVWYEPRQELPAIAPEEQPTPPQVSEPEQARFELPQRVTASDPAPESLQSMVRSDAPEIESPADVQLPNIISWKAPEVERPRFQSALPTLVAPSTEGLPVLEPPKIETAVQTELSVAELQQIARLRYQQQQEQRQTPQQQALEAEILALEVQAQTSPLDAAQFQQLARLRYQAKQLERANPTREALRSDVAPDIRAQGEVAVDVAQLQQLSRLRYQSGEERPKTAPQRTALDSAAPALSTEPVPSGVALDTAQFQELARLRYQAGRGAEARSAPEKRALADAVGGQPAQIEQLAKASGGSGIDVAQFQKLARLRYQEADGARQAAAPPARALGEVAGGAAPAIAGPTAPTAGVPFGSAIDGPAAPPPSGTGGDVNLVAVGVNPADRLPETLPAGSRRGAFTAGPETGEGRGATGAGAPVRVPNLAIDGPSRTNSQTAGAGDDLLASLTRRNSIRDGQAPSPNLDIVYNEKPIDIDNPFVGRPVYTMAVNMPNVTSYRGDWVLQFAELVEAVEGESDADMERRLASTHNDLTPPFPVIKVDPKYVASAEREQVQGIVVFYAVISEDGVLSKLRLIRGVDERLDAAAREALEKWEFRAAMKNGKAIAVESLIRIPFRLDPSIKMRY